ncbi:MAG: hypothetical protein PXX73_00475 [Sideroxydans sp.]|nr:hypothetical protein [Sideroxydans sp.]
MSTHNYYLHGWNENDANVLASFLYLIGDKLPLLGDRTLNPLDASIWLADLDSEEGREFWQEALDQPAAGRRASDAGHFKIALSRQPIATNHLLIRNPLRINGETGVLTVLRKMLDGIAEPNLASAFVTTGERRSLGSLFMQIAHKENVELIFPEQVWVLVDSKNEQCWANRHPRQWIRFFPQLMAIQPATEAVFQSLAVSSNPDCQAYPIDSIKWCLGLFLWKGEPSPQAAQQQTYQLKNWPNFTSLPHHPKHLSLTNHLVRHPRKIEELMEDTELSREFIQNFINACMAIDLLHATPSRALNDKRDKRIGYNPLRALLSRLGVTA